MNEEISTYRRLPNFVKKMMVLLDFVLAGRVVVDVLMIFFLEIRLFWWLILTRFIIRGTSCPTTMYHNRFSRLQKIIMLHTVQKVALRWPSHVATPPCDHFDYLSNTFKNLVIHSESQKGVEYPSITFQNNHIIKHMELIYKIT